MWLDISTAVDIFIKQVVRDRRFPFLPSADPLLSDSNLEHLMRVKADVEAGRNMEIHDLVEP
jgi:DNA-damage-inducible protein J